MKLQLEVILLTYHELSQPTLQEFHDSQEGK